MATVGHIKAEVLLKIEGMEDTYSVGHIEIPVNISTEALMCPTVAMFISPCCVPWLRRRGPVRRGSLAPGRQ